MMQHSTPAGLVLWHGMANLMGMNDSDLLI